MRNKQMQKKILVIDDDPAILELMQLILEDAGYSVVTTDTAGDVFPFLENNLPHIIVLDLRLSGRDGSYFVRQLKGQERTRDIPLIVCSASPAARQHVLAAGADDFLAKPFEIEELLTKVAHYV